MSASPRSNRGPGQEPGCEPGREPGRQPGRQPGIEPAPADSLAQRLAWQLGSSPTAATLTDRPLDLLAYAHDASHYLLTPQALIRPVNEQGVASVMRACNTLGVPLVFRSGGTSLSGQAQTNSLLVDTRSGFQQIEVQDDGARVTVQPGVTIRRANAHLARYGRKLGPDPASEIACTVGGVVANNSSGMQCGTTFNTYRTIKSLVVVLASGTVIDTGAADADQKLQTLEPALHAGLLRLGSRIHKNSASLATITKLFAIKNTMGYGVNSFVDYTKPVDILTHLMVGSEGTLGFVASATFATVPVLPAVSTALLVFANLDQASQSIPALIGAGMTTAELLDAASLRVSQSSPDCPQVIAELSVTDQAALLVELQAESAEPLSELSNQAQKTLAQLPLASQATFTSNPAKRAALWQTRKGLYSTVVAARPSGTNALLEDVAVPVTKLGEMCGSLLDLFAQHRYQDSVIFGHARDGNLHFLLHERFDEPTQMRRYAAFTDDLVALVLGLDGTLKAEHGTGRIMAPFVRVQYGDELYSVMREIKHLFDPNGVLNPGSMFSDDPLSYLADLKVAPTIDEEVDRCVECGFCEPVCPSQTLTLTPRQRIVARRESHAARARGDHKLAESLAKDFSYDGLATCAADGICATACPVRIDTGTLVKRLRAESTSGTVVDRLWSVAANRWSAVTRVAGRALSLAHRVPSVAATVTGAARQILGEDLIPTFATDLPSGGKGRPAVSSPEPQAVFFASCLGTMFGESDTEQPASADAVLLVAQLADVGLVTPVALPSLCCGTPWHSKGHLKGLERMRARVVTALLAASRGGKLPIVVEASSCTEGVRHLVGGEPQLKVIDALDFVAEHILGRLTIGNKLSSVVLHPTCSTTALGSTRAMESIARAIADEVVVPNDWGCCGFAGDRGMLHPELTAAATAREAAEVTAREYQAYASSNRTCELGMQRATGRPYQHILSLLAQVATGSVPGGSSAGTNAEH
jgi:D-lactate dehydrogenase